MFRYLLIPCKNSQFSLLCLDLNLQIMLNRISKYYIFYIFSVSNQLQMTYKCLHNANLFYCNLWWIILGDSSYILLSKLKIFSYDVTRQKLLKRIFQCFTSLMFKSNDSNDIKNIKYTNILVLKIESKPMHWMIEIQEYSSNVLG